MTKQLLANQLRKRQCKLGHVPKDFIDSISDDKIIDAYITCSCCGQKQVSQSELVHALNTAETDEHFFEICDRFSSLKSHQAKN